MSRRSVGRKYLTKEEMLKALENISDDNSGSEIESDKEIDNETRSNSSDEDWNVSNTRSESDTSDEEYIPTTINENRYLEEDNNSFSGATTDSRSESGCISQISPQEQQNSIPAPEIYNKSGKNQTDEETANDGTVWKIKNIPASTTGRRPQQNILREVAGPTSYAKRKIIEGNPSSAWRLFMNEKIMRLIQQCTEAEARTKLQNPNWCLSLNELDAFISLLYARGALAAKGLSVLSLWSKTWGPTFFRETMARDRFTEIMKYLRFDMKSTRSQRLQTDPFALISDVWYTFIENCIMC